MAYLRKKRIRGNDYLYEQSSYRDGSGRVRTRHERYVGGGSPKTGRELYRKQWGSMKEKYQEQLAKEKSGTTEKARRDKPMSEEEKERIRKITEAKREIFKDKEMAHLIRRGQRMFKKGVDSRKLYYNPKTEKYTKQREELHKEILAGIDNPEAKADEGEKPVVVFLGGPPGSGKSQAILKNMNTDDFVVIDSDSIKEKLPEYRGYNAGFLHEESSDVYQQAITNAIKRRRSMVLDATLKSNDKAVRQMDRFRKLGYEVRLYATNVPISVNLPRAVKRSQRKPDGSPGRYVPPEYIVENTEKINQSVRQVALHADEYRVYDTSAHNAPPTIIMEGRN